LVSARDRLVGRANGQAQGHVAAHFSESDESDFHGRDLPLGYLLGRMCVTPRAMIGGESTQGGPIFSAAARIGPHPAHFTRRDGSKIVSQSILAMGITILLYFPSYP